MPNRLIKESICTSDNLNSLCSDVETFFYRLIVNCDDYGLMDARPAILRAKCFPLKLNKVTESDIRNWLNELVLKDLIFIYESDGKPYLKMTKWENHQQIRSKKSKYPTPDITCKHMISNDITCTRNPIQSNPNPNPNPNTNMCVSKTKAEISKSVNDDDGAQEFKAPGKGDYTAEFNDFWDSYPRKKEKIKAFKAWNARLKEKVKYEDLIKASNNYALYCKIQNIEERYIKHPSTFLGPDKPFEEYIHLQPKGKITAGSSQDGFVKVGERIYDANKLEKQLLGRE